MNFNALSVSESNNTLASEIVENEALQEEESGFAFGVLSVISGRPKDVQADEQFNQFFVHGIQDISPLQVSYYIKHRFDIIECLGEVSSHNL